MTKFIEKPRGNHKKSPNKFVLKIAIRWLVILEGDNIGYGLKNGLSNDWIQNICLLKA